MSRGRWRWRLAATVVWRAPHHDEARLVYRAAAAALVACAAAWSLACAQDTQRGARGRAIRPRRRGRRRQGRTGGGPQVQDAAESRAAVEGGSARIPREGVRDESRGARPRRAVSWRRRCSGSSRTRCICGRNSEPADRADRRVLRPEDQGALHRRWRARRRSDHGDHARAGACAAGPVHESRLAADRSRATTTAAAAQAVIEGQAVFDQSSR